MSITETKCDSPQEALEQFEGTIAYAIAYNTK